MMRVCYILLMVLVLTACDTSRNTPDPQEKYFLRYYGDAGYQEAIDMVANDDGSFLLLGQSRVTIDAPAEIYLVKVNSLGFVEWKKNIGTNELAKDIEPSLDGYLILSDSLHDNVSDLMVRLIDAQGDLVQKSSSFSFPGSYNEVGSSVTQLYNAGVPAGFIATGYTDAQDMPGESKFSGGTTAIFIRFDQAGKLDTTWNNTAGAENDDFGTRVVQVGDLTNSEPFLFFGYFSSPSQFGNQLSLKYWTSVMSKNGGGVGTGIIANSASDDFLTNITPMNSLNTNFLLSGTAVSGTSSKIFVTGYPAGLPSIKLDIDLGNLESLGDSYRSVSLIPSRRSGYLVAANQIILDDSDIVLTKLNGDGGYEWSGVSRFGGNGNDRQAALHELQDGRIILFGTMEIGADRQSKMFLMKLNSKGQLRD